MLTKSKERPHEGETECTLWYWKMLHHQEMKHFAGQPTLISYSDVSPEVTSDDVMRLVINVNSEF